MVAIETFRWDANDTLTIEEESVGLLPDRSDVIFDPGDHVVLQMNFQGEPIGTALDLSATATEIYASLLADFPIPCTNTEKTGNNQIVGRGGSIGKLRCKRSPGTLTSDGRKGSALRPAYVMTKR